MRDTLLFLCTLMNDLHRAGGSTCTAAAAFRIVNYSVEILYGNGTAGTFLFTDFAADTAIAAGKLCILAIVSGGAGHCDRVGCGL